MYGARRISALIFLLWFSERRLPRKRDYQGRLSFQFGKVNDRSCHSVAGKIQLMSEALNLLFTEPINCAKTQIFRFESSGCFLCFSSKHVAISFFLC